MALVLVVHNDGTGTPEVGNYNWEVRINQTVLARGRVEGHDRRAGWRPLLEACAHWAASTDDPPVEEALGSQAANTGERFSGED